MHRILKYKELRNIFSYSGLFRDIEIYLEQDDVYMYSFNLKDDEIQIFADDGDNTNYMIIIKRDGDLYKHSISINKFDINDLEKYS